MKLLDIYKNFKNEQEQGQIFPPGPTPAGDVAADLDIMPMERCLHDRACPELYSRRGDRPGCFVNMERIFDLERCPANKWEKFD